ncbi:MAG: thiol:disulfide interchange protein DsbA/DsbL [Acidiferrobacteraceae bacterium]
MKKSALVLLIGLLSPFAAHAAFRRNRDYLRLFPTQPVTTGRRIEVREFFWYSCPHCFHLEPVLNAWLKHKPPYVAFVRTPAVLNPSWEPQARAYYTFQSLGVVNRLHDLFFNAIHIKQENLSTGPLIAQWAARHGVNEQKFLATYHSFGVDSKLQNAIDLARAEGVDAVPTLVVEGRYLTNVGMAGGRKRMMRLVDFLIQKARQRAAH